MQITGELKTRHQRVYIYLYLCCSISHSNRWTWFRSLSFSHCTSSSREREKSRAFSLLESIWLVDDSRRATLSTLLIPAEGKPSASSPAAGAQHPLGRLHLSERSLSFSLLQANSCSSYEMKSLYNATSTSKGNSGWRRPSNTASLFSQKNCNKDSGSEVILTRSRWGGIRIVLKRRANAEMLLLHRRNHLMVRVLRNLWANTRKDTELQ